jgi:hypothetical protein
VSSTQQGPDEALVVLKKDMMSKMALMFTQRSSVREAFDQSGPGPQEHLHQASAVVTLTCPM